MFQAGHLPGAVPLDWHFDLSHTVHGLRDWLLPPERFAAVMAAAGIGDDTTTVACAETDHSGAARLWWALRYYGHEQVAVLDGGLNERQAEGRPIETGAACLASTPVRFTAWPGRRADPLAARLFAVVDVGDALRCDRPYRAAWPEDKVREHIRALAGTHFEPRRVDDFLALEPESNL